MELRLPVTLVIITIRHVLATCDKDGCNQQNIIWKCCSHGQSLNFTNKCIDHPLEWDPEVRDMSGKRINSSTLNYKHHYIDCRKDNYNLWTVSTYNGYAYVREDGKLNLTSVYLQTPMLVKPDEYCIDYVVKENNVTFDALMCLKAEKSSKPILTASCMLVSCVFIALTLAVYLYLPQFYTVHGRLLVAYLVNLFLGFLLLAILQLLVHNEKITTKSNLCLFIPFVLYFALMCAFCWLNVMCYDIWRVFSGKRDIRPNKRSVKEQMGRYAIYAVGVPIILTILVISLELSSLPYHPWLPNVKNTGCFFSNDGRLLYLYGPLSIQCVANILFFVLTTVQIIRNRNDTSILNSKENPRNDGQNNIQTLILHVKLFILMGIGWILEVISSIDKDKNWIIADIYNIFIGLFIFVIFVCKRNVLIALKKRYREPSQSRVSQTERSQNTEISKSSQTSNVPNSDQD